MRKSYNKFILLSNIYIFYFFNKFCNENKAEGGGQIRTHRTQTVMYLLTAASYQEVRKQEDSLLLVCGYCVSRGYEREMRRIT